MIFTRPQLRGHRVPANAIGSSRDFALWTFSADPGVEKVDVVGMEPSRGHVTLRITGGDPQRVHTYVENAMPIGTILHVELA